MKRVLIVVVLIVVTTPREMVEILAKLDRGEIYQRHLQEFE